MVEDLSLMIAVRLKLANIFNKCLIAQCQTIYPYLHTVPRSFPMSYFETSGKKQIKVLKILPINTKPQ